MPRVGIAFDAAGAGASANRRAVTAARGGGIGAIDLSSVA